MRGYDPLQKAYGLNLKEAQVSGLEKQDRFISRHHIEDEMPPENPGLTSASPEIPLRLFGQLRKERGQHGRKLYSPFRDLGNAQNGGNFQFAGDIDRRRV